MSEATHGHILPESNLSRGDRVGLLTCNCIKFVEVELAAAKIGVISVNLNWRQTTEFTVPLCRTDGAAVYRPRRRVRLADKEGALISHQGKVASDVHFSDKPTRPRVTPFMKLAERFREDDSWIYREITTGHDAMITAPEETARLFLEPIAD